MASPNIIITITIIIIIIIIINILIIVTIIITVSINVNIIITITIIDITLIITVCCKLHNLCVDRFNTSHKVETAHEDRFWVRGRNANSDIVNRDALFTDGTNGNRCGNYFHGTRRQELTTHLSNLRARRPVHSQIARQTRI
jgi:hypothetical protein